MYCKLSVNKVRGKSKTFPHPLKFIYSEKATKFCEIFSLLLTTVRVHTVKSKGKISQKFVVFSEYMNFNGCPFPYQTLNFSSRIIQTLKTKIHKPSKKSNFVSVVSETYKELDIFYHPIYLVHIIF